MTGRRSGKVGWWWWVRGTERKRGFLECRRGKKFCGCWGRVIERRSSLPFVLRYSVLREKRVGGGGWGEGEDGRGGREGTYLDEGGRDRVREWDVWVGRRGGRDRGRAHSEKVSFVRPRLWVNLSETDWSVEGVKDEDTRRVTLRCQSARDTTNGGVSVEESPKGFYRDVFSRTCQCDGLGYQ